MCFLDRNVFLVDFENVNVLAFTGITALSERDEVIVLYTMACAKTPRTLEQFYLKTKATLTMIYAENGHKNALDFQLSSLLGRMTCEEKFKTKYYIIARDKGYDCLSVFLKRYGVDVTRKESIFAAINSLPDPIATAEVEGEEEEAEELLEELLDEEALPEPEEENSTGGSPSDEKKKDKKEKKDKKGKKDKKEKKDKADKAGRKKKKEPTILLVGTCAPWKEGDALLLPEPNVPAPQPVDRPLTQPAAPEAGAAQETVAAPQAEPADPETAFILQAIRERFYGSMSRYTDVAIEAYLFAVSHPDETKSKMDVAHRFLTRALRSSVTVKKVYALLKPFLK